MEKMRPDSYGRFYALLRSLPTSDRDELKRNIVLQYTYGRTDSLREMTLQEYNSACAGMERLIPSSKNKKQQEFLNMVIRKKRSAVLHQLQLLGIDTSDWNRVNAYCKDPRIAGKVFRVLDGDELDSLLVKLRIIRRKQ